MMKHKRSKIDNKRVLSDLSGKFNEKSRNYKQHAKLKQHVKLHEIEELKENLQSQREKEISRKEKKMQIYSMIEEKKRVLASRQLKVMNLKETEAFLHCMNPEEQDDYLDYSLDNEKVKLHKVKVDVDSMQDELTALEEEYEMTKIKCAKQVACARELELDAKRKLKNAKQREHDSKSDLELLTTFENTQKVCIDDMKRKNTSLYYNIPLEYLAGSEYRSVDPNQPREAQIEVFLGKLKEFCRKKVENARASFEEGCENERLWQEALAKEMVEVTPKTSREWKMENPNYPESYPFSKKIRKFQASSIDCLDMGNMNFIKASTFLENFPEKNGYGITVHLTANKINPKVTLVKNKLEIRSEPYPKC